MDVEELPALPPLRVDGNRAALQGGKRIRRNHALDLPRTAKAPIAGW